ncbi:hypothetical protein BgAZ_400310 [Babesia gibsoni]|uniref:Uncharacterized protein n=1 Tax=Babesia gibsoni TaxID=33632 RepID=A0AAD8LNH8_BABGI|nr:hypothetical protein BgAZ_400310 [Babesia gibsoni]
MSASLRDLMRQEKEARKRSALLEEAEKRKVRVVSFRDDVKEEKTQDSRPLGEDSVKLHSPRVLEETFELLSDSDDSNRDATSAKAESKDHRLGRTKRDDNFDDLGFGMSRAASIRRTTDTGDYKAASDSTEALSKSDKNNIASSSRLYNGTGLSGPFGRHASTTRNDVADNEEDNSYNSDDEETYAVLGSLSHASGGYKTNETDNNLIEATNSIDDDVRIYDQLNTAFCSRMDYEYEQIMGNVDISNVVDESMDGATRKATITSDNFGKSGIRLSKDDKLPEGFFDNRKADAEVRGKVATREAKEKLQMLKKSKAELLSEAKYLQEKLIESYQERMRLEHDAQEQEETAKELIAKVESIKNDIATEAPIEVDMQSKSEHQAPVVDNIDDLYAFDENKDMSWRMKSVI